MGLLFVALSAFIGAVVSGILGWLDAAEAFMARKFASTVLRALIAGAIFAVGYQLLSPTVTVLDILTAFIGGAGVDGLGNRLAGTIKAL